MDSNGFIDGLRKAMVETPVPEIRHLREEMEGLRKELGALSERQGRDSAVMNAKLDLVLTRLDLADCVSKLEG